MQGQPKLENIVFLLAEPNETIRSGLMAMLRSQGLRGCKAVLNMGELIEAIEKTPPDFIAVSDTFDDNVFQRIRDVRHHKLGVNPFTVITFMVDPENDRAMKSALKAGADDVMIKPVAPGKIVERAKQIAYNRSPFIATTEYIGPSRRVPGREEKAQVLPVINTLKDKMDGKTVSLASLKDAVDQTMLSIRAAQLDSHGARLGTVCDIILKAYELKQITPKLEDYLLTLVGSLEEAAKTARMIGEGELAEICIDFARQVEELAEDYQNPAERDLAVIRTLTKAFAMAQASSKGGG